MVANRVIFTFRLMQTKGFFFLESLSIKVFMAFFDNIRSLTFSYTPYIFEFFLNFYTLSDHPYH